MNPLPKEFYTRDVLEVAPDLLGKLLCRRKPDGRVVQLRITETEAYRGEEDTACHARAGKTPRTAVLYEPGGIAYVYLCYGIHFLMNIVTGSAGIPQAALIRGAEGYKGPGRLTKAMGISVLDNRADLVTGGFIWLEDDGFSSGHFTSARIGIDYASEKDRNLPWRFYV